MTEFLGLDADSWKLIGLTVGTAVATFFARRKMKIIASNDSLQIDGNLATKSVYATLRQENDRLRSIIEEKDEEIRNLTARADKAYQERNEAIVELAGLRAEAKLLREHTARLESKIVDMQMRIESLLEKGD